MSNRLRDSQFMQVDVFSDRPFAGNPVAVVMDADSIDAVQMQQIASWTNLSETTFVLAPTEPEADYRLRIFTPSAELPFAGHPTLGSAHALIASGRVAARGSALVQQCEAGRIALRIDPHGIHFRLPDARMANAGPDTLVRLEAALGAPIVGAARRVDVGAVWLTAELADAASVRALRPDFAAIAEISRLNQLTGVTVFGPAGPQQSDGYEVRSFAPAHGINEDPVCGSGNGCVAALLRAEGRDTDYAARQGHCLGREGRIAVRYDGPAIWIGGRSVTSIEGRIRIPAIRLNNSAS